MSKNIITVTESEVAEAIASGAAGQYGLSAEDLAITFSPGKFSVTARVFSYGLIRIRNFSFTGNLATREGNIRLADAQISPHILKLVIPLAEMAMNSQLQKENLNVQDIQIFAGRVEIILQ